MTGAGGDAETILTPPSMSAVRPPLKGHGTDFHRVHILASHGGLYL